MLFGGVMLHQAISAQPVADILWPLHKVLLNQLPVLPVRGLSQCSTTVHTHDDEARIIPVLLFLALSVCHAKMTMSY